MSSCIPADFRQDKQVYRRCNEWPSQFLPADSATSDATRRGSVVRFTLGGSDHVIQVLDDARADIMVTAKLDAICAVGTPTGQPGE